MQTSVIFISHGMGVVSEMADDVLVMKASKPIEAGAVKEVLGHPKAPYTQALLAAVPKLFDIPAQEIAPEDVPAKPVDRSKPMLEIKDLTVRFDIRGGLLSRVTHRVHAAEKVSFNIYPAETLALVGESGSDKSTVGKNFQQLQDPVSGAMRFHGQNIFSLPPRGPQGVPQADAICLSGSLRLAQPRHAPDPAAS
ncbi:ABC transporter family protein [Primorskyibacter sedentarius]|uniref:ABC transporter family protein n=1 Tax=Primorskyibacter sedentarius TaxID=745311 RepID=A0A4R3JLR5_9RHOB|nr:ATP-binding cassette domain-containing protein [Primorskyibacter sedentarius]TCS65910.1 ABC transporter family protein [Primorskyibacter sedentarius]